MMKMELQLVKVQSLTLSCRLLQTLQNHLLVSLSSSDFKKTSKEEDMELFIGRLMISCLSSCKDEEKQLSQGVVMVTEEELKSATNGDDPFNSSSKI